MIVEELTSLGKDMENKPTDHIPVMTREIIEALNPSGDKVFVDCTLGLGGHARFILESLGPSGRLIGIDKDAQSLQEAKERLKDFSSRCIFVHEDFRSLDRVLKCLNIEQVDGILFDLGISSFQLDHLERGFSFQSEGPLDMRMDQDSQISAYDLVNSLSEKELSKILKEYGEERWHNRIARYLVAERKARPIETTAQLRQIILRAIPYRNYKDRSHPSTRSFQALRIAVNRELESLEMGLEACLKHVKAGGRIAVISFHSLEDRIVKIKFKSLREAAQVKIMTKKPLRPTQEEVRSNPRARSARLRVAERL